VVGSRSREHIDLRVSPDRTREALVGGQQLAFQLLGERHVRGVGGREIGPEFKDPVDQPLVTMPHDREGEVIVDSLFGSPMGECPTHQGSAKARDHLHIAECGDVEVDLARTQGFPNWAGRIGTEEVFDEG
jgi:hypothetical protein